MNHEELLTTEDFLRVRGKVTDEDVLKDMFIFVNEKKVYYRALSDVALKGGRFELPLDVRLPLKEGANIVAVIVRENDELISREVFGAYRDKPQAMAERLEKTPQSVAR
ncbi:MAG: hypothetical protein R3C68_03610 [Myxococcota bacterium]